MWQCAQTDTDRDTNTRLPKERERRINVEGEGGNEQVIKQQSECEKVRSKGMGGEGKFESEGHSFGVCMWGVCVLVLERAHNLKKEKEEALLCNRKSRVNQSM